MNNARYQKAIQKIAAIPPEQQAALRSRYRNLDAYFAAMDAKKKLDSEERANNLAYTNAGLGLRRANINLNADANRNRMASDRNWFEHTKNQDLLSSGVGLAQAGIAGKMGRETEAVKLELVKKLLGQGV